MYRPLPKYLTIKQSEIEGLGMFATEDIPAMTMIGITHVSNSCFEDGYIRTPLGGFLNHSDNPNCFYLEDEVVRIIYNKSVIKKGEELTVKYSIYNV